MNRVRIVALVGISVLCLVAAGGYYLHARSESLALAAPSPGANPAPAMSTVLATPHVVFRNTELGDHYDEIAAVRLADPSGSRAYGSLTCERTYATAGSGVCVNADRAVVQTYNLLGLNAQLQQTSSTPLSGLPSRARISADGTLVSTTTFVSGHSYAQSSFSTSTIVRRSGKSLGNLESWTTILPNGQKLEALDRNFWGVTFAADDDTFYATAASNGTTWLVRGSLSKQTMTALGTDAECPSLSPDERRVAYKKRLGDTTPGVWRLAVRDLATGKETLLAETRSVDDQQEWLDDGHVLYGLPRTGTEATSSDIWVVPSDGSGKPGVYIAGGDSPAVVRQGVATQ